jgi:hypothetical protein
MGDCEEDIKQLEIDLINKYNTLAPKDYNLTTGGGGPRDGSLTLRPVKR